MTGMVSALCGLIQDPALASATELLVGIKLRESTSRCAGTVGPDQRHLAGQRNCTPCWLQAQRVNTAVTQALWGLIRGTWLASAIALLVGTCFMASSARVAIPKELAAHLVLAGHILSSAASHLFEHDSGTGEADIQR